MTIDALPAAPSTADPDNFDPLADAMIAALGPMVTQINASNLQANLDAITASTSATIAQAAAIASGAIAWVSGATYGPGDARYSLIDWQTYRRKTAGAGTTDPSSDTTNWARVAYRSTPTAMTLRTTSGTTVAPAGVTGVKITAVGAGGAGAANAFQFGGCGGSAVIKIQPAVAGDSFVCVIGGRAGGGNEVGGSTTITGAATIVAAGGGVGNNLWCNKAGASSGGDITITGDMGHPGNNSTMYGCGGRSHLGAGGSGAVDDVVSYGGGGAPGLNRFGFPGVVTFEWIY